MDHRERIVHGDEGLPVAVYELEPAHIRYRMNVHWHPEHEILHVSSGKLLLRVNDTAYALSAGDVVFIPGGSIHSGEPTDCRYTCILVNLSMLLKRSDACCATVAEIDGGALIPTPMPSRHSPDYAALCTSLSEVNRRRGEGYPFLVKSLIFAFFGKLLDDGLFLRAEQSRRQTDAQSVRMKAVIAHMEEHYDRPLRLSELAELADMTPNHLCRCFKAVTGVTPFSYLIAHRLSKAQYALKTTDLSVTAIALDYGFNDVSHFIRLFRETYGTTPKQYRRAALDGSEAINK